VREVDSTERLSVVVPSYERDDDLSACLESIRTNSRQRCEIIVLSPWASQGRQDVCRRYDALLREDGSRKAGTRVKSLWAIINQGIENAAGEYVCWLNDDCTVNPGWDDAVLRYFVPEVGLVVLRTRGINGNPEYTVRPGHYGVPVANYAVLRKSTGIRFDTRFSWFYGDADISLQMASGTPFKIVSTMENLVVHGHRVDDVRRQNEHDPRANRDQSVFDRKWRFYKEAGDRVVAMKPWEAAWSVVRDILRVPYRWLRFLRP